jgi:hypothetical protein
MLWRSRDGQHYFLGLGPRLAYPRCSLSAVRAVSSLATRLASSSLDTLRARPRPFWKLLKAVSGDSTVIVEAFFTVFPRRRIACILRACLLGRGGRGVLSIAGGRWRVRQPQTINKGRHPSRDKLRCPTGSALTKPASAMGPVSLCSAMRYKL